MRAIRWKTTIDSRRGATLVEAALVTVALLSLLLGTLDLGIAVLRYNMLSEAARTGARLAIVHGSDATEMTTWDKGRAETEIKTALAPLLAGSGASDFTVTVTYDAGVTPGRPVTVTVQHNWVPIVSFLFGTTAVPLTANSKMIIAN